MTVHNDRASQTSVDLRVGVDNNAPLYRQVHDVLSKQIASGSLMAGEQLLSERQLCERFGISRVTARRALIALEDDGLIGATPGRGWFVSEGPLSEPPNALLSFTLLARARGLKPTARVLRQRVRPASLDEADELGLAPGAELFELERVRLLDGLPVAVDNCVLALYRCPSLRTADFSVASLYEVLRSDAGVSPTRAECTLESTSAGPSIAPLLDLRPDEPVLVSRQTTYDRNGVPVETSRIVYRGDRYRFRSTLTA